jgi:hypothetical protein
MNPVTLLNPIAIVWRILSDNRKAAIAEAGRRHKELQDSGFFEDLRAVVDKRPSKLDDDPTGVNLSKLRAITRNLPDPEAVCDVMGEFDFETAQGYIDFVPVRRIVWSVRRTSLELAGQAKFYNTGRILKSRAGDDIYRGFGIPLEIDVDHLHQKNKPGWHL